MSPAVHFVTLYGGLGELFVIQAERIVVEGLFHLSVSKEEVTQSIE